MFHWLHHLLNPHCPECNAQKDCKSCYTYREQLSIANAEKQRLLELLIQKNVPVHETPVPVSESQNKAPISIPWHVHRRILEESDRVQAQLIAQKEREIREAPSIEEIEKELNLSEAGGQNATSGS